MSPTTFLFMDSWYSSGCAFFSMWQLSFGSSPFCYVNSHLAFSNFQPCIDDVILPGIFLIYAIVWYLVDIAFFSSKFWYGTWVFLKNAVVKVKGLLRFFCGCFGKSKEFNGLGRLKAGHTFVPLSKDAYTMATPLINGKKAEANFIDEKCGSCQICTTNDFCPMKSWKSLKSQKNWYRPYIIFSCTFGFLSLAYNIGLSVLPDNKPPHNLNEHDKILIKLISIAPEWHHVVNLMCNAIISAILCKLMSTKMNRIPKGTMTPSRGTSFSIHLLVFSSLLSCASIPSVVSNIRLWTLLPSEDWVPVSVMWSVIIVISWIFLIVATVRCLIIATSFLEQKRRYNAVPLEIKNQIFFVYCTDKSSSNMPSPLPDGKQVSSSFLTEPSWIKGKVAVPDGCGCACCSKDKMFKISRDAVEMRAGLFKKLTFSWISPLVALGYSRPLQLDDLISVPPILAVNTVEASFTQLWQSELRQKGEKASFFLVCWRFCRKTMWKSGLYKFVYDSLSFTGPLILQMIIRYLEDCHSALYEGEKTEASKFVGSLYANGIALVALMVSSNVIMTILLHQYFHEQYKIGIALRAAVVGLLYSKSLKISLGQPIGFALKKLAGQVLLPLKGCYLWLEGSGNLIIVAGLLLLLGATKSLTEDSKDTADSEDKLDQKTDKKLKKKGKSDLKEAATTGEIVNLMAVDAQRLQEVTPYIHLVWSSPYQVVLAMVLLWRVLGPSMLAGVGVMAISIPVTIMIAKKIKNRQQSLMKLRDERIKITNEVVSGMKIIKVYAWESSFEKKVIAVREEELKGLWRYALLTMGQRIFWSGVPLAVSLVSLFTFVAVGNQLTADTAFAALALFNLLRFPLNVFPMILSLIIESTVASARIRNFILRPEVAELPAPPSVSMDREHEVTLSAQHLTLRWPNGSPVIDDASFECKAGTITAIIGRTGTGKTALLAAIIGDLLPSKQTLESNANSSLTVMGRLAYVAQTSWIMNATLRENILFGRPFNPKWYATVVRACALKADLDILPGGDMTEIGEKGVNLSGGQKQRVSLARAVYQSGRFPSMDPSDFPADIYILDDCLSAVDSHVGQHIFEQCIVGLLRRMKRTVVFCTHKVDVLDRVDQIIFLERQPVASLGIDQTVGKIIASGTFDQMKSNDAYINFTEEAKIKDQERQEQTDGSLFEEMKELSFASEALSTEKFELNACRSFIEQEAIESKGTRATVPTDPMSTAVVSDKFDGSKLVTRTSVDELALRFKLDAQENRKAKGVLTEMENLEQGAVGSAVYKSYFNGLGGPCILLVIIFSLALSQGGQVASNAWLAHWTNKGDEIPGLPTGILVYASLAFLQILLYSLAAYSIIAASQKASRYFHHILLVSLLRAPMAFFDATPLGRIINRFSKDLYTIDQTLPNTMNMYASNIMSVTATFVVIIVATPWFAAVCIPLLWAYRLVQNFYIPGSRQLQRIDSVLRSPIFAHFGQTLDGVPTIRAYRAQRRFKEMNTEKLDYQQRAYYLLISSNRWLAVRLESIGTLVVGLASLLAVFGGLTGSISASLGGLAISYALNVTQSLNWMVRMASDRESNIVSVERVEEYAHRIPQEASSIIPSNRPNADWPSLGQVEFTDFELRYRSDLPLVLKALNVSIKPQEKIGIVGRTGAGKSSLLIGILRLVEPAGGTILVDGVNIADIGLFDLRSKFSIIPQDPVLFTGTLRSNLDPFEIHDDDAVWLALERAHLKSFVLNEFQGGLNGAVEEGGKNLSMGQKQLICLARALLRRSKVLLLDEATSAVDPLTDRLIQMTIKEEFSNCTILTIAHRIGTIMDYDKILVLDAGSLVEFGPPKDLMQLPNGYFHNLCGDSGLVEASAEKP